MRWLDTALKPAFRTKAASSCRTPELAVASRRKEPEINTNWPHAPAHRLEEQGAYIVTCGTHQKRHHLNTTERLSLVQNSLFQVADEFGWMLQAWAVLSNHYHFIALSPGDPKTLSTMLSKLHTLTAKRINQEDDSPGRQVWFQYWDSHITFQTSYYSRLKYVHNNPVHHGVTGDAVKYRWCSAAWFAEHAKPSFVQTIDRFKTDSIKVSDDFKVISVKEGAC